MSAHRFALGDRVTFTGAVEKTHDENRTFYVEVPAPRSFDRVVGGVPYTEGIIFGRRTVVPGTTESSSEGDDWWDNTVVTTFHPTPGASRRVWLVAFDLRRKPVMCFDEQLQEVEDA